MKLFLSEKLQPITNKHVLLIKIQQGSDVGFSSLCSWPHLGDPSLENLKLDLLNDQKEPLVQKSLYFALHDLKGNNRGEVRVPKSHTLIDDEELLHKNLNEEKIKLKPKKTLVDLAQYLNQIELKPLLLRLDFNNRFNEVEIFKFLANCSQRTLRAIEFIEDPVAYNESLWKKIKQDYPDIRLALDHCVYKGQSSIDYYIWKPAKTFFSNFQNIIPTHYMSDETEWLSSLWECTLKLKDLNVYCGFGTEHLALQYSANDKIQIGEHWNQDIDVFNWVSVSDDFFINSTTDF